MTAEIIILSHLAFPQLTKLIRQYYKVSRKTPGGFSSGELSQLTTSELTLRKISGSVSFLHSVGILETVGVEGKKRYRPTELGEELGLAIDRDDTETASSRGWARVVNENAFLTKVLHFIESNDRVELGKIKQYIVIEAGRDLTTNALINGKTIVDILEAGRLVTYEKTGKKTIVVFCKAEESSRYIRDDRITSLNAIKNKQYDLSKLIELCREINYCYEKELFYAVGILVRALIDHVPPIFGYKTFTEVANNYGGRSKSFKASMKTLDGSTRDIADSYAHEQIKAKMDLANSTQVNCRHRCFVRRNYSNTYLE